MFISIYLNIKRKYLAEARHVVSRCDSYGIPLQAASASRTHLELVRVI